MRRARATGLAHSVHDRLKAEAEQHAILFTDLLTQYAGQRLLHRLGESHHRSRFALKGATVLEAWLESSRLTRDLDLMGPGDLSEDGVRTLMHDLLGTDVEDDGLEFEPHSLRIMPIRAESIVRGFRVRFAAYLGRSRIDCQVDIGLGDECVPEPVDFAPKPLLGMRLTPVRAYTRYTAVAEKLEAMVKLGELTSRLKDYYDIVTLSRSCRFDGRLIVAAVRATFKRRGTPIPQAVPPALATDFAADTVQATRWSTFQRRHGLEVEPSLEATTAAICEFALPVFAAGLARGRLKEWPPGGPWRHENMNE